MTQYRILFADDDVLNHWLMTSSLTEAGFAVTGVCRGSEAMRLLQDGRDFDLLLTDFHLPDGISGFDLAAEWRYAQADRPIIYITPFPQMALGSLGLNEGFVPKHAEASDLLRVIGSMLPASFAPHDQPCRTLAVF